MKNLKRILSLALASTMLVGMLVVGANAATFSDDDKITHAGAVESLYALGIMNGMGDGTFNPQGTLTRAQMAKLLATVFNNGDDDLSFAVNEAKPTFTDVKPTAWYAGYVEYAANYKIVNGNGDGTFSPEGKLTVAQAARMLLNAMGYSQGEGDWKLNTIIQARETGIFAGLTADEQSPNAEMTRDAAAQMLWTAIKKPIANGTTETKEVYTVAVKGEDTAKQGTISSIAGEKFDTWFEAYTIASTLAGAGGTLDVDYTITKGSATVTESLATKYLSLREADGRVSAVVKQTDDTYHVTVGSNTYEDLEEDYTELLGRWANVMYKALDDVYGINPVGSVVATIDGSEWIADQALAANKRTYTLATSPAYYTNGAGGSSTDIKVGSVVELINENGDAKIELVRVVNKSVATLTADPELSTDGKKVSISGILAETDIENVKGYEDLKEDDVVLYVTINGVTTFEKAEKVTGTVAGIHTDKGARIGGSYYQASALPTTPIDLDDLLNGKEYDFFLDNGGNIVANAVPSTGETAAKKETGYLVLLAAALDKKEGSDLFASSTSVEAKAKVVLADGTQEIVTVASVDGFKVVAKGATIGTSSSYIDAVSGKAITDGDVTTKDISASSAGAVTSAAAKTFYLVGTESGTDKVKSRFYAVEKTDDLIDEDTEFMVAGKVYAYTVEKDGVLSLTNIKTANGADLTGVTITKGSATLDTNLFGNAKTVFLVKGDNDADGNPTFTSYVGIANIPTSTEDSTNGSVVKNGSIAEFVYLSDFTADSTDLGDQVYVLANDTYMTNAGETATYTLEVLLNGEKKEITITNDPEDLVAGNLYPATVQDDVYTLGAATAPETGIAANAGNTIVVNNTAYTYTSDSVALTIDLTTGKVTAGKVADVKVDANDTIIVVDDHGEVETVYVVEVSNAPTVAIATATDSGNTLTVDADNNKATGATGKKLNVNITLAPGTTLKSVTVDLADKTEDVSSNTLADLVITAHGTHTVVVVVEDNNSKAQTKVTYTFTTAAE